MGEKGTAIAVCELASKACQCVGTFVGYGGKEANAPVEDFGVIA